MLSKVKKVLTSAKSIDEAFYMVKLIMGMGKPISAIDTTGDRGYCFKILVKVSRSFAVVIQELPEELKEPICIFYLVLRALDTLEDDPNFPNEEKVPALRVFGEQLDDPEFEFDIGRFGHTKDYKDLCTNFNKVKHVYSMLDIKYRRVIRNITDAMAHGMIEFLERDVETMKDWDLYCHYVAGLVGTGLTDMFVESSIEKRSLKTEYYPLANEMGLFLQKTNIIRDYFEDIYEDRIFWPKAVWSKYADKIEDFTKEEKINDAVHCANELITNALRQVPNVLVYMDQIQDQQNFNFCVIPQVMAIATLAEIYNNPNMFKSLVKIRRGMTAKLIYCVKSKDDMRHVFAYFTKNLRAKIVDSDPNAETTKALCDKILNLTKTSSGKFSEGLPLMPTLFGVSTIVTSSVLYLFNQRVRNFVDDSMDAVRRRMQK